MKDLLNQPLKPLNTFRIDGITRRLIEIDSVKEIDYLFDNHVFDDKFMILGGGSNLLFCNDFNGTIIRLNLKEIQVVEETEEHVFIKVAAGEIWDDFVSYCLSHGYYGVENLIGIPGRVGSAPVQNIGAYGVEVKDVFYQVEGLFIADKSPFCFSAEACDFGYRNSVFKNRLRNQCLITSACFKLSKKESYNLTYSALNEAIKRKESPLTSSLVAQTVLEIRNAKLPDITKIGCAGSFFKNPVLPKTEAEQLLAQNPNLVTFDTENGMVKFAAARLIELCGCKEWKYGDVAVYPTQSLVIVNYGDATGTEVYQFYQRVTDAVKEKFGILLEPEVNIVF